MTALVLTFAAAPAVVAGLILHAILFATHLRGAMAYTLAGAGAGVIIAAAFALLNVTHISLHCAFAGGVAALVAWLIRRPDRDAAHDGAGQSHTPS